MNPSLEKQLNLRINKLEKACLRNNFAFDVVEDEAEAREFVNQLIHPGDVVTVGGSMSLFETGIISMLEDMPNIEYLDRYNTDDDTEVLHKAFDSDVYITSTNAITMQGELYNVDGRGNRVAAMIYGPEKVLVVVGLNKIVEDLQEAKTRVEKIAAPANAIRLNKQTPCMITGECAHCKNNCLCNHFVTIQGSHIQGRIHILLVKKILGY